MKLTLTLLALVVALSACKVMALGDTASTPSSAAQPQTCPEVRSLDPSAFRDIPAGACVTLMPPAARKAERQSWCPAGSVLQSRGNVLSLIGAIKTLLRRDGDEFFLVAPDQSGVKFVKLEQDSQYVYLNEARIFEKNPDGGYTCLIDTLASLP